MRLFYPGQFALPAAVCLAGLLMVTGRFDIIQVAHYQNLWPLGLIAAGLEELYFWAASGKVVSKENS